MSKEEQEEFDDWAFELGARESVSRVYSLIKSSREYYEKFLLSNCHNKKVLEYGCGTGSYAFSLAKHGAKVVGIDISELAIKLAKARAKEKGLEDVAFLVVDAEEMQFEESSFDLLCGTGILHHLQIDKSLKEIVRILKPEGEAIFREPMGHNPAINLFRKLTPHLRTKDEHPLKNRDLELFQGFFHQTSYSFFHLFSLLAAPFRNTRWVSSLLKTLDNLDRILFERVPLLRFLAWQVVIILERPKKAHFS